MDKLFLSVLNMSLTGAFVIAAICLARLPLKKAPKIISYALWAVAGFRLVFPFSIESVFSLLPFKAQPIPPDIAMQPMPRIDSGIPFVNNAVSSVLSAAAPIDSVNPLQVWTFIGSWIWIVGVAVMLVYGVVSFVILKRKMRSAAHIEVNIYEADCIQSPFVLGVFAPKIYLPVGLSEHERGHILLHEQMHVRRCDHIVKFAAYFVLCLHWFNPFAWVAFLLMGADMEMSCDERVLKEMGSNTKKDYSLSLLSLSTMRRIIGGSPLAFGEGGMKERVKSVLRFRKATRPVTVTAIVIVAAVSIGLVVNRPSGAGDNGYREGFVPPSADAESYAILSTSSGYNATDDEARGLYEEQRVAAIISAILLSDKIEDCSVSIRTDGEPLAEVMLTIKGGEMLSDFEVQSIADTIRGSVAAGLAYENIHISDNMNNLYQIPENDADVYDFAVPFGGEQAIDRAMLDPQLDDPGPPPNYDKSIDTAIALADYFVDVLNKERDLTGDNSAMESWYDLFDFGLTPVYHSGLSEVEYSENVYQFTVYGTKGETENSATVLINMQGDEPFYFCAYTRYYQYVLQTAWNYVELLSEGDVIKLARWLSVDGGPDPTQDFIQQAERGLSEYNSYDLQSVMITGISYDNDAQRFFCMFVDANGVAFRVTLSYGDGLIMPTKVISNLR